MEVPYVGFRAQYETERKALLEAVERIFSAGAFVGVDEIDRFEEELAALCGTRHAVGVANGTDAIALVLKALQVGPGDEVITAPNSFVASAGAIRQAGARPVFADVRDDLNIDPDAVAAKITSRTKAILPVHLTGRCCDMDPLLDLAARRKIPVVEDAAQAVGAVYKGRRAGSMGTAACFSFHPLKNLNAAGDAGAVVTNDASLAERLRRLRNHGLSGRDAVVEWGVNSRLDGLQAAILRLRMKGLEEVIRARRKNADRYRALLGDLEVPREREHERHTYHLFVLQTDRRDALRARLKEAGVETKIHYPIPIHLQEAARELGYAEGSLPVAERQARRIVSLPVHQYLEERQVDYVAKTIAEFLGR